MRTPSFPRPWSSSFAFARTLTALAWFCACLIPVLTYGDDAAFQERFSAWQAGGGPPVVHAPDYSENSGGEDFSDLACLAPSHCRPCSWWARKELLVYWRRGQDLPPLVTTDSDTLNNQNDGRLPAAPILFGGGTQNGDATIGGRIDMGTWLRDDEAIGIGGKFFILGNQNSDFNASNAQLQNNQLLAIPFSRPGGVADSFIVASQGGPQQIDGSVNVKLTSEIFGAEAYGLMLLRGDCNSRLDFMTGYQFGRINEGLQITATQTAPANFTLTDTYRTYNEFHGGIIGLRNEARWSPCITLTTLAKLGIGNMNQHVRIRGQDTRTQTANGLLTEAGDTGDFSRNVFAVSPEFNATLGIQLTPCVELLAGYTLLYYTNVARPGQQINTVLGETNSNPFVFRDSSLWLNGLNVGLVYRR